MNRRCQASDHASRKSGCSLRRLDRGRMGNWGRSKYDDSNKGNKIDRSDAVFKLRRLWVGINGDGTAGTMETFTLDMDDAGVDMAKLKASLDAAGQQALAALQQLKVQSIDLSTMKFKLGDGSQVQASTEQLKGEWLMGCRMRRSSALRDGTARLVRDGVFPGARLGRFREIAR